MSLQINKLLIKYFKHIVVLIFVFGVKSLYSQTIVQGKIQDTNSKPIEFATIQLLRDTKTIQSALTDSVGNYFIETNKNGNYEIAIRCLGYITQQKKLTLKNDTVINFVLQVDTNILDVVTITGEPELIQAKSDRYIVNIAGSIDTKGKETSDILKQLPTINISNQTLSMFGKTSAIVYINDRVVRLQGQSLLSYLNSLPPGIIKSVEIITTPPAQYEAEGNVGIIKIVTNKNILPGWKEYLRAGYIQNSYSSYMLSGFANYTGKKMFFDLSLTNGIYSYLNQSNYYSYFPNETVTTFNPKKWNYTGTNAKISAGYDFSKKSNIIIDFQIPFYSKEAITDIENQTDFINPVNNQIDSTLLSNGETQKNKQLFNSEIFFKHLFSNDKSYFTVDVAYLNNYTQNSRAFTSITEINNSQQTTEDYYTEGNQNYNILTSKLDFSFPILSFDINTGLKLSFIETSSKNDFFYIVNNNNVLIDSLSNKYNYDENIQAAYCSISKNIKKWSFKAGIRSEITQTLGQSLVLNEQYQNDYIDFFPTIYISHKINDKNNISFSYSDRIERPPYQYLDPFRWYISKYDYAEGNPFLKPAYIKNVELNYLHNNSFSAKIYYTYQNDKIGRYVVLDSLNIKNQIQKTDNFLNSNTYGVNIYKLLKFKILETVLQGDFAYSEYLSNNKEFSNISGINGTLIMNNTFFVGKKFSLLCNLEEGIPGLYNYRTMKNYFRLDIGGNFIHSEKGFEVRLLVSDIFKTANPEYYYESGGIRQTYNNYFDTRALKLILVWKLGNWYNKSAKIYSPSNSEEKERL